MPSVAPFTPGTTVSLSATTASGRVALNLPAGQNLVITNLGPDLAYVATGDVTVAAVVATSFPVLPGTQVTVTISGTATYLAAICPTSTATLKMSSGDGVVNGIGSASSGAAGGVLQTVNITQVGSAAVALGQAVMASSIPVVIASNQTKIPTSTGIETTATPAAVALTASTAATLLAANANRVRMVLYNPLATALFVRKATLAGSPATVSAGGYDFVIPSLGTFISDPFEYPGAYNGICATAGSVNVSETV